MSSNKVEPKKKVPDDNEDNLLKSRTNISDLIHTVQFALIFEYCFGIYRFHIVNNGLQPTNRRMKLVGILIISAHVIFFYYFLKLPSAITGTASLVDTMDEVPSIVILLQYVTSAIMTSFLLSVGNINIFTTFANLDSMLHINTNQDFYKASRSRTFRYIIVLAVYHIIVSISDLLTSDEISLSKIIVLPIFFEENLEILIFCLIISMLKSRLNVINKYLTNFMNDKENSKNSVFIVGERKPAPKENFNLIGRMSYKNMKIRDLAVTYDIIGETCCLINQVFNFQIFMTLVSTFTYIIITIWTSLTYYRTPSANFSSLITIILWCITAIFKVAFMSLACERLLLTRNESKILVNKVIMDYDLPKPMRMQAKAFMDLIEAWPLRIFIYDMFSVDITLMLKYISVATTYLIVIIQVNHIVE
ncbi:uncharacterized protein LOC131844965 [Achroia grisella]|uniref:uncharacterized protein LOC131844965 n=1 Tax=Achroia grisella TaxID=688607 RepID=UPI0027D32CEB|nr:uncharacterized protein LOC131844965 [Achroia grisella]